MALLHAAQKRPRVPSEKVCQMYGGETGTASHHPLSQPESYLFQVSDIIDGLFLVRSQVGQGGMGAVLRVENLESHKTCALKYCRPGERLDRFAREVRMMERAQSHYVISILHSNLDHDPPYFVMPLAERSLQDDLTTLVGDETTALEIFRQICVGVQDLHEKGIIHRDLKPANVLRLADGRMVVSDLGLGKFESRDTTILTRTIQNLGTEDYLAPEQRQPDGSRNADARTDVYQLGKVLYQIITGRPPRWIELDKLSPGLAHIVRRATSENPGDRYPSVEKLEAALSAYRSSKDPHNNPREVLEHLVARLETQSTRSVPTDAELTQVLELLSHGAWLDHSLIIECFHRIPEKWLPTIARKHETLLFPVLSTYATAIHESVKGTDFKIAEVVASHMTPIYERSQAARIKVLALRNIMIAAERMNRFKAQKKFCTLLQKIKVIELALPVAEMINDYAKPGLCDFAGYNINLYHPTIQDALNKLKEPPATRATTEHESAETEARDA